MTYVYVFFSVLLLESLFNFIISMIRRYEPINPPQQIYSKLDDVRDNNAASSPIYDDIRIYSTSTTKFGLSRYGHLKIDYSYNWNSLNKYICN